MMRLVQKTIKIARGVLHTIYWSTHLFLNKGFKYCHKIQGHLSLKQGIFLYKQARKLPVNSVIVELGSYVGKSTCFIAEGIGNKQIKFITVDTFENQGMSDGIPNPYGLFTRNISKYKDKITVMKGFSFEVVKNLQNINIDLLWIDACHEYEGVKRDITDWLPLVKPNGLICFHDYYVNGPECRVKKAVNEAITGGILKKIRFIGDNMILTRKI